MVMSTISVHMASVDLSNYLASIEDYDIETLSFKESGMLYMKRAPFNIPSTLYKTGTLAFMFSTLKYGGVIHVIVLALTYYLIMKHQSTHLSVTLAGINIFTTTLGVEFREFGGIRLTQKISCVRICTWLGYIINVTGLLVCCILSEHTEVTFHCETHDWLRPKENLQIACWSLAGLGLLSCILTEIHIQTNPIEKVGKLREEKKEEERQRVQQPENEQENIEMIANP